MTTQTVTLEPGDSVTVNAPASSTTPPPSSGGILRPDGWATQIDTGHIMALPAGFHVYSPSAAGPTGEWAGNLLVSPAGRGMRVQYQPNLWGGYSPVRFGIAVPQPGKGGYYQEMLVTFSAGFVFPPNTGIKLCEPRTMQAGSGQNATENHVVGTWDQGNTTDSAAAVLLQGPNGNFRDLLAVTGDARARLTGGAQHRLEVRFLAESEPGAGDGQCACAVDGVVVFDYRDVLWLAAGNLVGWPFLMFDPTYGGAPATLHPPAVQWWEFDHLTVATDP